MIEFNLLPDVKLKFVKTRRLERLVVLTSVVVAGATLAIFLFLLVFVDILQRTSMNNLGKAITAESSQLQGTRDINKILTIQNQLASLPALHDQEPVASRLFGYMSSVTPAKATISSLKVDFVLHAISINGNADSISTINQFVDTLKFTTYTADNSPASKLAFSNVVLTSFSAGSSQPTYAITAAFDPLIFSEAHTIQLTVPSKTTTRSIIDQPNLFKTSTP